MLRDMGRYAFDTENTTAAGTSSVCEQWSRHLLLGAPRPGDDPEGVQVISVDQRDWVGARRFFTSHRQSESRFVAKAANDLRQVLSAFVQSLDGMLVLDTDADNQVQGQLERLRAAVHTDSLDALRREALSAVTEISRITQGRRQEQRTRLEKLYSQVKELDEELQVARQENLLDPLTNLFNRRAMDSRFAQAIRVSRLFSQPSCILLVDLDHFKSINDTYGHGIGDKVLMAVSACLTSTFRVRSDFVARYGGEEFAVILWDTPLGRGRASGERLLQALRELRVRVDDHVVSVTASIGVAEVQPGDDAAVWVDRADKALYEAKRAGRDRLIAAG